MRNQEFEGGHMEREVPVSHWNREMFRKQLDLSLEVR